MKNELSLSLVKEKYGNKPAVINAYQAYKIIRKIDSSIEPSLSLTSHGLCLSCSIKSKKDKKFRGLDFIFKGNSITVMGFLKNKMIHDDIHKSNLVKAVIKYYKRFHKEWS